MVSMAWPWTGLGTTSQTGCNLFNLTITAPLHKRSVVMSPRDPSWALFFLLFINDINNVSKLAELILFADDANLFAWLSQLNNIVRFTIR